MEIGYFFRNYRIFLSFFLFFFFFHTDIFMSFLVLNLARSIFGHSRGNSSCVRHSIIEKSSLRNIKFIFSLITLLNLPNKKWLQITFRYLNYFYMPNCINSFLGIHFRIYVQTWAISWRKERMLLGNKRKRWPFINRPVHSKRGKNQNGKL